jgi:hypothetical protein
LLPITFETATSPRPANAASIETTSSGVEVPIATIVNPIVSSETPNRRAMRTTASTSDRAPTQSPRTVAAIVASSTRGPSSIVPTPRRVAY